MMRMRMRMRMSLRKYLPFYIPSFPNKVERLAMVRTTETFRALFFIALQNEIRIEHRLDICMHLIAPMFAWAVQYIPENDTLVDCKLKPLFKPC